MDLTKLSLNFTSLAFSAFGQLSASVSQSRFFGRANLKKTVLKY